MKKFLITTFVLASLSIFAQTRTKQNPSTVTNSNPSSVSELPNIKRPSGAGFGVPLAEKSPFIGGLENFKPLVRTERPTLELPLQIMRDDEGDIIMIKGSLDKTNAKRDLAQRAKDYIGAMNVELPLRDAANEFRIVKTEKDELGIEHTRMQQTWKGVDVYGAEIILHGKNETFDMMNGRFYPTPNLQNATPTINDREAQLFVEKDLVKQNITIEGLHKKMPFTGEKQVNLVVFHKNRAKNDARLAWHLTVFPSTLSRYEYFVDANTGEVIHSFAHTCNFVGHFNHTENEGCEENLPPVDGPATVTGISDLFGIGRTLNTHNVGGTFYMIDTKRSMFNAAKSKLPEEPVGAIWTLDAFNTSPEKSSFNYDDVKSSDNTWSNQTAVSAHYNGGIAYDYFKKTHVRESINGKGGTIISLINIADKSGKSLENAFWNGEAMFYGNGGASFFPLAKGLDVAGHEMSHGVIQETAGLEYQGESGAMNESFADIFGAMIDRKNWQIGEDVVKKAVFPSGALRDLSNPNNGGASLNDNGWQPKQVSEQYKGTQDNGGVHINSGITNFAFYKFSTATTKEKGEKVFYQALTKYLVKSSKFIDLRAAVAQSATDLYGAASNEVTQAKLAFDGVGIGGGGTTTGDNYQPNTSSNPGSDFVAYTSDTYVGINILDVAKNQTFKVSSLELNSRPVVTDDGSTMVFVATDKKPYFIDFDWAKGTFTKETGILASPIYRNVAISKDGNLLAVTKTPEDGNIIIYDFTKNPATSKTFTLYNPTYTDGISTGDVLFSDALEFDITGEYLMYDARNQINGKSGTIKYWDIGFMRVYDRKAKTFGDGKIEKLFSDLPEKTSVGNPQFSKNSPHIVVFDYIDYFDKKRYAVSANLQTGKTGDLVTGTFTDPNSFSGVLPTFSRKDDKIAFEDEDFLGSYIATIDLGADKISVKSGAKPVIIKDNTHWPQWFSNGVRKLGVGTSDNSLEQVKIYPNPVSNNLIVEATEILDNQTVSVLDMLGKTMLSQKLSIGKNNLNMSDFPNGTYILKVGNATRKVVKM